MPNALNKGAGSEASLPVTLRVRRRAPQAALSINSTLSRQMGATDQHGRRFSFDAGLFFRCRGKTESVSYRNRKAPAAAGQSSLCAAGVVMQLENVLRLLELRVVQLGVEAAFCSNSSCVPDSMMSPWRMTRILSAFLMVERRCAMTNEVRPFVSVSIAC